MAIRLRTVKRSVKYAILAIILSALIISGSVTAVLLLTQTFPVITAATLGSTSCTSGPTPLTANVSSYVSGVDSYIRFTCTADGRAYYTSGGIVATPTFSLPSPFTQLWSFRSTTSTGGTCSAGTQAWQMTSASPHTFPNGGTIGWDYCALIPSSATVDSTSFTVAWTA